MTNIKKLFLLLLILDTCLCSAQNSKSIPENLNNLAKPSDITLKGSIRSEELNTALGTVHLRWPRTLEASFGRTPSRAVVDATMTVSRALKSSVFPKELQVIKQDWQVVFIGGDLRVGEIPMQLINNCHPGWMTAPANIYIVGDRIAGGCGTGPNKSAQVADADLTEVLVHELGHAVEAILLGKSFEGDRMRAEGFATWFESYASSYSTYLNQREIRHRNSALASFSLKESPGIFTFRGSPYDYARGSLYFSAVEEKFGLSGIMRLYTRMQKTRGQLMPAIQEEFRWTEKDLAAEVSRVVDKYK